MTITMRSSHKVNSRNANNPTATPESLTHVEPSSDDTVAVSFQAVGTRFPGAATKSLDDISFTIQRGEIFGVIGTSGAGKSTLVRTINGLHQPTEGTVTVLGQEVTGASKAQLRALRRDVSMVFQHHNLLESATIADNVGLPLVLAKTPTAEIASRVEKTLELVGLGGRGGDYPAQLSGGQRQRVGIARALVTNPTVLLCDEATSALDPITTVQILDLIGEVAEKLGITVVIITHEMAVIARICDRVAVLDRGHLIEKGPVAKVFAHPGAQLTKRFVAAVLPRELPASEQQAVSSGQWNTVVSVTGPARRTRGLMGELTERSGVRVDSVYAASLALRSQSINHLVLGISGNTTAVSAATTLLAEIATTPDSGGVLDINTIYPTTDDAEVN